MMPRGMGTLAAALAEARASVRADARPTTPADGGRQLFGFGGSVDAFPERPASRMGGSREEGGRPRSSRTARPRSAARPGSTRGERSALGPREFSGGKGDGYAAGLMGTVAAIPEADNGVWPSARERGGASWAAPAGAHNGERLDLDAGTETRRGRTMPVQMEQGRAERGGRGGGGEFNDAPIPEEFMDALSLMEAGEITGRPPMDEAKLAEYAEAAKRIAEVFSTHEKDAERGGGGGGGPILGGEEPVLGGTVDGDEEEDEVYEAWATEMAESLAMLARATRAMEEEGEMDALGHVIVVLSAGDGDIHRRSSTPLKAELLRRLFDLACKQVEVATRVRLRAGRIFLTLEGKGKDGTCTEATLSLVRSLYQESKDQSSDAAFAEDRAVLEGLLDVLEGLVSAPAHGGRIAQDACVYASGCLKNVSGSRSVQDALAKYDAIGRLTKLLSVDNSRERPAAESVAAAPDFHSQVLIQITGCLRNLAMQNEKLREFVDAGVIGHLARLLDTHADQRELMVNVVRILSKLSINEECRKALLKAEAAPGLSALGAIASLLGRHRTSPALVVRTCFTLGNLTVTNDRCRQALADTPGALESVMDALVYYGARDAGLDPTKTKAIDLAEHVDCLVKMFRLVANLTINPELGKVLSSRQDMVDVLPSVVERHLAYHTRFLRDLSSNGGSGKPYEMQTAAGFLEVTLNGISALTNLTCYEDSLSMSEDAMLQCTGPLSSLLVIFPGDSANAGVREECILEATRLLGNLSTIDVIRRWIVAQRMIPVLALLLDHSNRDITFGVCGVLLNLSADQRICNELLIDDITHRLMDLFEHSMRNADLLQGGLVCKTLHNIGMLIPEDGEGWDDGKNFGRDMAQAIHVLLQNAVLQLREQPGDEFTPEDVQNFLPLCDIFMEKLERLQVHWACADADNHLMPRKGPVLMEPLTALDCPPSHTL